jgi:hypothetical protein
VITKPLKLTNPAEVDEKIQEYFARQDAAGRPYTVIGIANALGLYNRDDLYRYERMDFAEDYLKTFGESLSRISDLLKRATAQCEEYVVETAITAKNPAGSIFIAKNMGYKDKTEVEIAGLSFNVGLVNSDE